MRYIPRFVRLIVGWVMAGFFMLVFGVGRGEDGRYCSAIYGVKVSSFGEKISVWVKSRFDPMLQAITQRLG